jgi:hypothetical protein
LARFWTAVAVLVIPLNAFMTLLPSFDFAWAAGWYQAAVGCF